MTVADDDAQNNKKQQQRISPLDALKFGSGGKNSGGGGDGGDNNSEQSQPPSGKYTTTAGGIVIGPDGKPCRSCTSVRDWMRMANKQSSTGSTSSSSSSSTPTITPETNDCPPDVELLGRSTWTLLHSIAATYPTTATTQQQSDMRSLISSLSRLYPCYTCATDFQQWLSEKENEVKVKGRSELGMWLCNAHNEVNRKLGKQIFDCRKWEERWKDGWKDGRCG